MTKRYISKIIIILLILIIGIGIYLYLTKVAEEDGPPSIDTSGITLQGKTGD